jgi:hypothetical protein
VRKVFGAVGFEKEVMVDLPVRSLWEADFKQKAATL